MPAVHDDNPQAERWFQESQRLKAQLAQMVTEATQMRGALMLIAEWRLPHEGFAFDNGSNGEREHFRAIARKGLPA